MSIDISVKACDNELFIVAFNYVSSYLIADIKSGNHNSVDVPIVLYAGAYTTFCDFNNVNGNPDVGLQYNVGIPAGTYSLMIVGVNWGGPAAFTVSVNNTPVTGAVAQANGVVWTPPLQSITVN